jgi:hypothetical protein
MSASQAELPNSGLGLHVVARSGRDAAPRPDHVALWLRHGQTQCGPPGELVKVNGRRRARLLDGTLALGRMCGYRQVMDEFVSAFLSVCHRLVKSDLAREVDAGWLDFRSSTTTVPRAWSEDSSPAIGTSPARFRDRPNPSARIVAERARGGFCFLANRQR